MYNELKLFFLQYETTDFENPFFKNPFFDMHSMEFPGSSFTPVRDILNIQQRFNNATHSYSLFFFKKNAIVALIIANFDWEDDEKIILNGVPFDRNWKNTSSFVIEFFSHLSDENAIEFKKDEDGYWAIRASVVCFTDKNTTFERAVGNEITKLSTPISVNPPNIR